jgi:acetyl-CoA synthetase
MADPHITSVLREDRRFAPSDEYRATSHVKSREEYEALYRRSIEEPEVFWLEQAAAIPWITPPTKARSWTEPHAKWFEDGRLNASAVCLDRWRVTPRWSPSCQG